MRTPDNEMWIVVFKVVASSQGTLSCSTVALYLSVSLHTPPPKGYYAAAFTVAIRHSANAPTTAASCSR